MKNFVLLALCILLTYSCRITQKKTPQSDILNVTAETSDSWLLRKYPCKKFSKRFNTAKDQKLRAIADRISTASPELFGGKKISEVLCFVVSSANPGSVNNFYQIQILQQAAGRNAFPDFKTGFISFADGYALEDLPATVAHELSHFLMDHQNLWRRKGTEKVESARKEIMQIYEAMADTEIQTVEVMDRVSNLTPEEQEKEVNNPKSNARATIDAYEDIQKTYESRLNEIESFLKKELHAKYSSLAADKTQPFGFYIEAEADEVGFKLYSAAGYDAKEYLVSYEKDLFENDYEKERCEALIKNGKEPKKVKDSLSSHPNPCWRVWNLRRLHVAQRSLK